MSGPYEVGDTVKMTVTITNPDNADALFDPASVTFKVLAPGSTTVLTPSVTHVSTGVYTAQQVTTAAGDWWWRVEATGPTAANNRTFHVNPSVFP